MKISLIVFSMAFSFSVKAQVAINTTGQSANSSAILDISSNTKGVLLPRVYLQNTIDKTTVSNPAPTLLLYNTNPNLPKGAGFYFNTNTAASPNWQPLQTINLPFYEASSAPGNAFTIDNYSPVATSTALRAFSGNVGVGVQAVSVLGNALEVDGKIKIDGNGQSPAQGKVLTSDANGQATWEGAIAFAANGVKQSGSEIIADFVETKVAFGTERYDLGNNYNNAAVSPHSTFIVPVKGIYHFDVKIAWTYYGTSGYSKTRLILKRNGAISTIARAESEFFIEFMEQQLSIDTQLLPGDEVYVTVWQSSGDAQTLNYESDKTYFNGRLVVKL